MFNFPFDIFLDQINMIQKYENWNCYVIDWLSSESVIGVTFIDGKNIIFTFS